MKVWINKRTGDYSGGMILVAANSADEAHMVFHSDPKFDWMWYNITWETPPYVDDSYYQPENWEEMPMLEANVDKPQVLAEAGYTE
uniref:Uncharacterized protein n=1 Tax=Dulem virus 40 TaxID=3145758 RepID=A0AAU8AWF0_9CAUD